MSSEEETKHVMDQRKRKRMISNRESARRSRMRKQQQLNDLVNQVSKLKDDNNQILMQINLMTEKFLALDGENAIRRTQVMELTDRLRASTSMLRFAEELSGLEMDIPEIPDPLLKPWRLPCPAQPIVASANMFQF